jgi:hypothetical protein
MLDGFDLQSVTRALSDRFIVLNKSVMFTPVVMAEYTYELFCPVEGDGAVFSLDIASDKSKSTRKELIHDKHSTKQSRNNILLLRLGCSRRGPNCLRHFLLTRGQLLQVGRLEVMWCDWNTFHKSQLASF